MSPWIGILLVLLVVLALDLGLSLRKPRSLTLLEAAAWTIFWILVSLGFNVGVYFFWGATQGMEFFVSYILEKALSIDNLFVFLLIFRYFAVPPELQQRLLCWGILGAVVLRGTFIWLGSAALQHFHGLHFFFGFFLLYSGFSMLRKSDTEEDIHLERNAILLGVKRWLPVTSGFEGGRLFLWIQGRLHATPMLLVLIVLETTDMVFALDSLPAIFGVTTNLFVVFTSNILAVLSMRALFFAISGLLDLLAGLNTGLSLVLVLLGAKTLIGPWYTLPLPWMLAAVSAVFAGVGLLSWRARQKTVRPEKQLDESGEVVFGSSQEIDIEAR